MSTDNKQLKIDRDYVTYEDFGAVGDGKNEDFGAIYKAHEYANAHGLTVKGTAGKTYYIRDTKLGTDEVHVVKIKTNVDWCGAHFIIDDTEVSPKKDCPYRDMAAKFLFSIEPDDEHKVYRIDDSEFLSKITAQGFNQKTKKINLGIEWDGPVMIVPYNSAHGVFRRRGMTQFMGEPMHELIIVDKDGNVSEETPIMFSYAHIDYMDVYKLDPKSAITVENGVFTTLESRVSQIVTKEDGTLDYVYCDYVFRGMEITRSYTTVQNIEHIVTGGFTLLERASGLEGAMYGGFFTANNANRITIKNCIIPGRTSPGPNGGHSSYGFNANCVNKIVLDGCFQPNFWVTVDPETYELKDATAYDENAIGRAVKTSKDAIAAMGTVSINGVERRLCWGLGGTNYCKNMEYINSTVTRFDAHAGLYNGKIVNCNVSGMELTGYGDMTVEKCNWYQYQATYPMLHLRSDYGFHWNGDILIKDTNAYMLNPDMLTLVNHRFENWYFGYITTLPNVTVDNLRFFDQKSDAPIKPGYRARLFRFTEISAKMHTDETKVRSIFAVVDADGDGYIDEPLFISDEDGTFYPRTDVDGDGKIGNTSLKYEDYINTPTYKKGVFHPTCTANLNRVRPPKYFKVINNTDENGELVCHYTAKDTAGEGISDGGWYREANAPDTMGGFFGGTKFIYGDGENDFFVGTENKNTVCETFDFYKEYDP